MKSIPWVRCASGNVLHYKLTSNMNPKYRLFSLDVNKYTCNSTQTIISTLHNVLMYRGTVAQNMVAQAQVKGVCGKSSYDYECFHVKAMLWQRWFHIEFIHVTPIDFGMKGSNSVYSLMEKFSVQAKQVSEDWNRDVNMWREQIVVANICSTFVLTKHVKCRWIKHRRVKQRWVKCIWIEYRRVK